MASKSNRLPLPQPPTHGGKREGAGRKRRLLQAELPHRARPDLDETKPLHVTLRMTSRTYSLRSARSARVIERSLLAGVRRADLRVVQVSVQGNHVHLLVEADGKHALCRGMRGLAIRLAKGMNRMMGAPGRVIADRYHARTLRTPTEVRTVMHYLRHNHRHHVPLLASDFVDRFVASTVQGGSCTFLAAPTLWLVKVGWRRGRVTRTFGSA